MRNSKVLEMLNQNHIEELKAELQDEIFMESLKTTPTAKKRYAAMKRYLKNISSAREILQKPCEIEYEGKKYNSFCNSYSLAFTTESCGEIEMCDEPDRYPDVTRVLTIPKNEDKINITAILAEAKSKGYKYTKNAIHSNEYLLKFKGAYFRMGLFDITCSVIDDGGGATVYYSDDKYRPITITNDIGIAMVLPIRLDSDPEDSMVVVEVI